MASIYSGYVITWYYTVVLGWAIRYFFTGFKSPLPWSWESYNFEETRPEGCREYPLA